ncbi:MAG: PAS domain-containing sensor histidine kinase [Armatimonadota bacterium]
MHREQESSPWFAPGTGQSDSACPYRDLIDNLDALVLFVDRHGMICHANRYVAEFLQSDRERLQGMPVGELLDEIIAPGPDHDQTMARLLTEPVERRVDEVDVLRPDGSEGCVSLIRRPVHDPEGELLGVVAVGLDITARREAERQRVSYQEALRSLTAELALTEERQRRSIATRIHEEISQNLAYAKLRVGSLNGCAEGHDCQSSISEINELLDGAIAGTRALAFELSPPLLHELGFSEAVEWLTEQFEDRHNISCEFCDDGRDKPLPGDVAVTLFRAVAELLRNVAEHAEAERARVSVTRSDGQVHVCVSDDGHGFDVREALKHHDLGNGFGLFNIRERMDYLGGKMQVASDALTGTSVTLTAPISAGA